MRGNWERDEVRAHFGFVGKPIPDFQITIHFKVILIARTVFSQLGLVAKKAKNVIFVGVIISALNT